MFEDGSDLAVGSQSRFHGISVFRSISMFAIAPISVEAIFPSLPSGKRLVYCKCYF